MAKKTKELTIEEKLENALVPDWEQPYKLPENWCWTRLGEVCIFERGITFPASAKEREQTKDNIACIRTANVQENLMIEDLLYVNKSYMKRNENKFTQINDIIMSSANSRELVGKTCYVSELYQPMTFGGFVLTIRAKEVDSKFIFYMLRLEFISGNFMKESTQTTNIANINTTILSAYHFPLPPLTEQKRIVDRIESLFAKLDEAKELAQSALDSFENRKSAILHKAFTGELTKKWREENGVELGSWEETTIDQIGSVKGGKRLPKGEQLVSENTGFPYIRAGNLKNGTVIMENLQFLQKETYEQIKNYTVKTNDVYITIVGACIGDVGIIPDTVDGANLTENAAKITGLTCNSKFLAILLSNSETQNLIKGKIASATLGKLSLQNIRSLKLNLPTLPEQQEIVRILDNIFAKETEAKELVSVIDKINLIKKSILSKAFRGELGTNDVNEESSVGLLREILEGK